MQLHHRRLLLTSHVLCDAWAFARPSTAAFPVCTAALKRVMLPNICVQGSTTSTEIDLFLHDGVRPFTMSFVFKLSFECDDDLQPTTLLSLMQRITATMPYLETLRIDEIPSLGDHAAEFVAALHSPSLRMLLLTHKEDEGWNGNQVQVLSKLPFLEELECDVSSSGLEALLPLTLPTGDESFFPRIRSLTVMVTDSFESTLALYQRALQSPLIHQLRDLDCTFIGLEDECESSSISLEPLAHIERLSNFLMCCQFSAPPDFSLLENCRELGKWFLTGAVLPGAVDLSGMRGLESIGASAFYCTRARSIIFPPSLTFIGGCFCAGSSITELDLSPCARSLECVDTNGFLSSCRSLQKFDTTPLLGAIGSHVGTHFLQGCDSLTEVDLSGLRGGVTSLGKAFMGDCRALRVVSGCDALMCVENVGTSFLFGTSTLEEFDFEALTSLREIGSHSVLGESALEEKGMKILTEIMEKNNAGGGSSSAEART